MGLPQNLGRLSAALTSDASLNIGVGVTPSGSFKLEVGTTSKFTGVATFGSTLSNGTYSYTLPSATGTLALTSDLSNYVNLTTDQTIAGFKTFSSTIKLANGTSNAFSFESGTTGFYASLKAPAGLGAGIIVTLPSATGTIALTSDIHSAVTLSAIGATANANGATLTGQVLNLQPADASFGGVVTTGTQTFAGAKTLTGALAGTSATFSGDLTIDTNTLYVDSTNNRVGIGTASPKGRLEVADVSQLTNAGQWLSSTISMKQVGGYIGDYSQIVFGYHANTQTNGSAYIGYVATNQGVNGYGDLVFGTRAVNTDTQPTERLRIASTGAASFSSNIYMNNSSGAIYAGYTGSGGNYDGSFSWYSLQLGNNGDNYIVAGHNAAGGVLKFYTNNTNRVINTSPNGTLALTLATTGAFTFNSTVSVSGSFQSSAVTPYWQFQSTGAGATGYIGFGASLVSGGATTDFVIRSDNALKFAIGGTAALSIASTGEATFSGALTMSAYSYASTAIQFTRAASNLVQPASGNGMMVFAGGNAQMRIDTANQICFDMNNGGTPHTVLTLKQSANTVSINSPDNSLPLEIKYQNVASGYLGAYGSALYGYSVNGGYVLLNSSSVWVAASDIKRKRNFETYSNGLSSILGLQPKLYNMDFQEDGDEKQVGLVAQEVKEFIPKAYNENGDFIGLDYNAIIVTMVNAIQELNEKITQLENK